MAYDQEFLKITWGFTIASTDEIAQTSLNFTDPQQPAFDAAAALADLDFSVVGPLLLARMATLLSTASVRWADYSRLNYVRAVAVGVPGLELGPALIFEDSTPAAGSQGLVPPQSSIVLSTRSGLETGAANFGRMYLPHTMPPLVANTPFVGSGDTAAIATAAATFVNGVATDLSASVTQIVEATIMTQVAGQQSKVIASVAIGNVIDTQRRRRNQLTETYAFAPIP